MKRFVFILSVYLCVSIIVYSQDMSTQEAIKNINKIKMDNNYLYAESTNKEWEEAFDNAKALLSVMISEWAMKNEDKNVDMCVANSKEHILAIKTRRGELYRSFVYVKKSDIIPISDERNLMVVKMEKENEKETTPMISFSPVVEKVSTEENLNKPIARSTNVDTDIPEDMSDPITVALVIENKMKQIHSFDEVENFVNQLKKENRLKKAGKYKTMPDNEDCYLLVYNPQGTIPAVLRKKGSRYFNLNTHQADNIANYEGCGAIWIQIK